MKPLRVLATADLHWGIAKGMAANENLCQMVLQDPPDLFLLGGDVGHGPHFDECLGKFASLPCLKALIPGNHDIWVTKDDPRGDSLALFNEGLPALANKYGFHYLDFGPLHLPNSDLSIVGSINWYDYSWSEVEISRLYPDEKGRLITKKFSRGQHNDFNYIRWNLTDGQFTALLVDRLKSHLKQCVEMGKKILLVTHHPACRALGFPKENEAPGLDRLLWEGFSGNLGLEKLLEEWRESILCILSGHTHFFRHEKWLGIPCVNIGGDYHFKRTVLLEFPGPNLEFKEYHA